jgi:hypothetical protein
MFNMITNIRTYHSISINPRKRILLLVTIRLPACPASRTEDPCSLVSHCGTVSADQNDRDQHWTAYRISRFEIFLLVNTYHYYPKARLLGYQKLGYEQLS